jgi:hypothetical protein
MAPEVIPKGFLNQPWIRHVHRSDRRGVARDTMT